MGKVGPAGIAVTRSSHYRQDLPEGQLCRYCFYSRADFWVFRPAGATRCTDQGEIWWRGADLYGPLLPTKFHLDRFRGVGLYGPKNLKKGILPI